ncbi:NADPH-dependent 2,4-dienoyl-CoA reductase, sulfur reductase [Streptomyces misionensis]|uniref:NADPH-dependent 2,4-dienoyl-CoA reductase, sulfur reductase n=1 Tax=Streptomyces misionensis TaxID=67331 RepID=A0A1H4R4V2_9ACTN|nr:FAD/NAD(P)-binding oxidoreductase [Streptomyces misionensis]SEC26848.1 NADPH-dependent 2,4-dienoyl-CoA reductase, sulfur reductase [Streptomyces misionensis]
MSTRHVAVVGAGPAGLAAAQAALAAGARVTLLDSADQPGGQYHRMLPEPYRATRPERLQHGWRAFDRRRRRVLGHPRCAWWPETSVWALERPDEPGVPRVHLLRGPADGGARGRLVLDPDALVLAAGAHDRVLPFPGWELPGVFTAGAAQALAKGERVVVGDRVVIAGTGPFLLPVAASLLEAGSRVLELLEANPAGTVARGWARRPWQLAAHGGKAGELAGYTALLLRHRVPCRVGRTVVAARGDGRVEEVVTARLRPDWSVVPGTERTVAVDALCVGHGFSPQLELPVAAGCALRGTPGAEFVAVDDDQLTSCPGVYAAGEITGVAGAPAARAEGALAGWLAAGGAVDAPALRPLRRARDQGRAFAARLAEAHPVGAAWPGWLRPDTVVCRCEETDYASLCRAAGNAVGRGSHVGKLESRAGLGPCQGRICGPTVAQLTARPAGRPAEGTPATGPRPPASGGPHHRPIAQPIRLGELAAAPAPVPDRSISRTRHPKTEQS